MTHRRARSITSLARRQENCGPTTLSILVSAYQVRWRSVEERLATNPHEAIQLDSSGCSVLYRALVRRTDDYPPFPIVRSILRAYPRAIWERHNKTTILEIACRRMASLDTLELLTQARPAIPEDTPTVAALWKTYCDIYGGQDTFVRVLMSGSAQAFEMGCKFQLLLRYVTTEHLAPCNLHTAALSPHCSLELFKLFYQVFPEQIHIASGGQLPLHLALSGVRDSVGNQVRKAQYLLDEMPESVCQRGTDGRLPLHIALETGLVDETNVKQWSGRKNLYDNITIPDPKTGMLPFQMAALTNVSVSIIYQLLRPVPMLVKATISVSYKHGKPSEGHHLDNPEWISSELESLLDQVKNTELWDGLHQTLRTQVDPLWHQLIGAAQVFSCPPKLLELLIAMHPEKLQHEDHKGWLPLHHAVAALQGDQQTRVTMILDAFPEAAHHPDKCGYLPFHLACLLGKGTWILQLLQSHNPNAIYQPDWLQKLPPVLLAAQSPRATLTNVFYLLISTPDVVMKPMHCYMTVNRNKAQQDYGTVLKRPQEK